jgi:hypothetical protein
LKDWLRHLPFMLVLFIVLYVAFVDLSIRADSHVLVTLLAPILWLGLYLLGSDHAASER